MLLIFFGAVHPPAVSTVLSFALRPGDESNLLFVLALGVTVLLVGPEFTVASDILRTAVAPTRQDILNLGATVLLRTLLNYFLEREIQQGEKGGQVG